MQLDLDVIVTVDDAHLATISNVAAELANAGMVVKEVMPVTGVITGSIPVDKIDNISVDGATIELSQQNHTQTPRDFTNAAAEKARAEAKV